MFHGGTNFGFMAGANEDLGATNEGGGEPYAADTTSYGKLTQMIHLNSDLSFLQIMIALFLKVVNSRISSMKSATL
jgi:hypothetical protein